MYRQRYYDDYPGGSEYRDGDLIDEYDRDDYPPDAQSDRRLYHRRESYSDVDSEGRYREGDEYYDEYDHDGYDRDGYGGRESSLDMVDSLGTGNSLDRGTSLETGNSLDRGTSLDRGDSYPEASDQESLMSVERPGKGNLYVFEQMSKSQVAAVGKQDSLSGPGTDQSRGSQT